METLEELLEKIEMLREKMITMAKTKKFSDSNVVEVSEKLDNLLNQYELEKRNKHSKKTDES